MSLCKSLLGTVACCPATCSLASAKSTCHPSQAHCSGHLREHASATLPCRSWTLEQIKRSDELRIAVLYASAYGNTAGMAQVGNSSCVPGFLLCRLECLSNSLAALIWQTLCTL